MTENERIARIVADHWRRAALEQNDLMAIIAHPMCMVLAALDGETDPEQLGVGEGPDADEIRNGTTETASPRCGRCGDFIDGGVQSG